MKTDLMTPQTTHQPKPMEAAMQRHLIAVLRESTEEMELWQSSVYYDREAQAQAIIKRARAVLAATGGATPPADPLPGITRFAGYEIAPVHEDTDGCEICAPSQAHFWTLYGHIPGEGVEAISDLKSRAACEELLYRITGRVEYFYNGLPEEEANPTP